MEHQSLKFIKWINHYIFMEMTNITALYILQKTKQL